MHQIIFICKSLNFGKSIFLMSYLLMSCIHYVNIYDSKSVNICFWISLKEISLVFKLLDKETKVCLLFFVIQKINSVRIALFFLLRFFINYFSSFYFLSAYLSHSENSIQRGFELRKKK